MVSLDHWAGAKQPTPPARGDAGALSQDPAFKSALSPGARLYTYGAQEHPYPKSVQKNVSMLISIWKVKSLGEAGPPSGSALGTDVAPLPPALVPVYIHMGPRAPLT